MSVEAITWAFAQPIQQSSTKFVLVAMANCADGRSFECYPSIAYLCEVTAQNRKTVIDNIRRLVDDGLITDTGEKKGRTGSIKAYRLNVKAGPKTVQLESEESANDEQAESRESSTGNGTAKQYRKRNGTENGTVPKTVPLSSTENGTSASEAVPFSDISSTENGHEAVPKTGHGTVSEPSVNLKESGRADATPPTPQPEKARKPQVTFDTFVGRRKAVGEKLISADDPIFEWAESAGIPEEWLRLAWIEFSSRYRGQAKRYADWPATFRNAVRNNWFRFWRLSDAGHYALTTEGEMARRAAQAADRQHRAEAAA